MNTSIIPKAHIELQQFCFLLFFLLFSFYLKYYTAGSQQNGKSNQRHFGGEAEIVQTAPTTLPWKYGLDFNSSSKILKTRYSSNFRQCQLQKMNEKKNWNKKRLTVLTSGIFCSSILSFCANSAIFCAISFSLNWTSGDLPINLT